MFPVIPSLFPSIFPSPSRIQTAGFAPTPFFLRRLSPRPYLNPPALSFSASALALFPAQLAPRCCPLSPLPLPTGGLAADHLSRRRFRRTAADLPTAGSRPR